jgi:hypothetical protein
VACRTRAGREMIVLSRHADFTSKTSLGDHRLWNGRMVHANTSRENQARNVHNCYFDFGFLKSCCPRGRLDPLSVDLENFRILRMEICDDRDL